MILNNLIFFNTHLSIKISWQNNITVLIPTREDWCMPGKIAKPNVNIWYMDRSGISIHFDADVHGPRDNQRESIPMGSLSTVLQAEMMVHTTPLI